MKKSFKISIFMFLLAGASLTAENSFNPTEMIVIPKTEYIIGEDCQTYTAKRTVNEFSIARYETVYSLWYSVMEKAKKLGYKFQNPGQEGSEGKYASSPTEQNSSQPVTMISWYDAIVWCNAYSETSGLTPCYTYKGKVIKDSTNTAPCDLSECNFFADGYRLPTEAEWELAARWHPAKNPGEDNVIASGGEVSYGEEREDGLSGYYWTSENTDRTHKVGTSGTAFEEIAFVAPGSGLCNAAGIFDMTGNVLEYCWDWYSNYDEQEEGKISSGPAYGSKRISRGGSWSEYTLFEYTGDRYSFDPNECYNYMGFRVVQSR